MSLSSMTGYARHLAEIGGLSFLWEAKSVNGRGLDIRCRLGPPLDRAEIAVREAVGKVFKRGSITLSVQVSGGGEGVSYAIDEALLGRYVKAAEDASTLYGLEAPRIEGLMALPGIVLRAAPAQAEDEEDPAGGLAPAHRAALEALLGDLKTSRLREGERLGVVLGGQIDEIARLTAEAAAVAATQPGTIRDRLAEMLADLAAQVAPERLAQEAALIATRADVREEIDRLAAHVAEARALLARGQEVGRRLDFLAQEFNREANTLCSKSADIGLTRLGLDLKTVIDCLREQVQNIE